MVLTFIETQIPLELELVQFVGSMLFFEGFRLQLRHDFQRTFALVHLAESNQGIGECISRLFVLRLQVHGSLQYLDGVIVSAGRQVNLSDSSTRFRIRRIDEQRCEIFQHGFVLPSLLAVGVSKLAVRDRAVWIALESPSECHDGAVEVSFAQIAAYR